MVDQDILEIKKKLDQLDQKLEDFCTQQIKNTMDILWIKRVGMILATLVTFLGTQLYYKVTETPKKFKHTTLVELYKED